MAAREKGRSGRVMARPPLIRSNSFRRVALDSRVEVTIPIGICLRGQIAWVLYGQASRAISTG